jgi:sugar phosphate isomerase/epimerase
MHLGIFARTFPRPSLEETLDAIADRGLTHVQFNMSCCGLPTLPERLDENLCIWIARSFRERGLTMAAISGTFNLCDPDAERLQENFERLKVLAAACRWLDTRIITLCTGTRDPEDMWRWHPDNVRRSTWETLVASMREAVQIADRHEVILAFEPEINNVVYSVARARMLLDEVDSPWLKVVIDPANLLRAGDFPRMEEVLDVAFDWLGQDIVLAHAKNPDAGRDRGESMTLAEYGETKGREMPDLPIVSKNWEEYLDAIASASLSCSGEEIRAIPREVPPTDFPRYLADLQSFYAVYVGQLASISYGGALILHGLSEQEVAITQALIAGLRPKLQ